MDFFGFYKPSRTELKNRSRLGSFQIFILKKPKFCNLKRGIYSGVIFNSSSNKTISSSIEGNKLSIRVLAAWVLFYGAEQGVGIIR